uniref:Uncharacterized protein n=1 Tax=Tanacetum cinerariifolium TaxID=118510 RepID=A0A6L2KPC9_TANCI|nr:hypothetical protein [Tanacetum cinerariifolium]
MCVFHSESYREEFEEDLVTHFQDFQNISESSDDSTNVVNAPREPFVVKQDHESFVDKIIHTFSSYQRHCFHCKDVLRDGESCQRCTCTRCGSGLSKGLCLICGNNQNFLSDSPSISANSSHNPPHIDECCFECGDALNGIFCQQCACKSCGKDYTIAITPVLSTEEPDNSLSMGDEHLDIIPVTESDEVIKSSVEDLVSIPSESEGIPDTMCDVQLVNNPTPLEAKDHFEIVINSNDDYSSSDDDSLYYEDIQYVEASPHDSELIILEVEKIVIPKDEEIEDDNLHEKLLKVNLLIAKIEALKDNLTPSSEFLTKSSSTSPKPFLEGTDTFDNSLPDLKTSALIWKRFVVAVPQLILLYLFRIMKLSLSMTIILKRFIFPPTDRSDFTHEEFGDEPTHIISPPEYECFYFGNLPDPGELISSLNSGIHENLFSTTSVNLPVEDDHSPLLAYVAWIFLAYLTYPVIPPYLHLFENKDTIFDPGITINHSYSFKPGLSHRYGTFKKFNTHRSHLNESLMEMLFSTLFLMDQ